MNVPQEKAILRRIGDWSGRVLDRLERHPQDRVLTNPPEYFAAR